VLYYLGPSLAARFVVSSSQPQSMTTGSRCTERKGIETFCDLNRTFR